MNYYQIAIDGPAGAGKSTVSKEVAKSLDFIYVDTGAMYRSIGYYLVKKDIGFKEIDKINEEMKNINVEVDVFSQTIKINGENMTPFIRTKEATEASSIVGEIGSIREVIIKVSRDLAQKNSVVMDGRDTASVVLPNSILKIYLTASVDERTKRRLKDNEKKCIFIDFEELKKSIENRDERDSNRKIGPLTKTEDAIEILSDDLDEKEVVNLIIKLFKERAGI